MTDSFSENLFATAHIRDPRPTPPQSYPLIGQYAFAFVFIALATLVALLVQSGVPVPNLTLIYVLPVVTAATLFGWGPSLLTVLLGVAACDFFFIHPSYSLAITGQSNISTAVMLLVVASIVASIAAESRRRAIAAHESAERRALQTLARAVIEGRPQPEIAQAAATALHQIFKAPTAILLQRKDTIETAAIAGGAFVTPADRDAACGALLSHRNTRGKAYPYKHTCFDFWPVSTGGRCRCVLGIDFVHARRERPAFPEQIVDVVAACIAATLASGAGD